MSTRKRITELSVAELRTQLNKRGVEAEGDKPTLIAKLKKALQDEGIKPSGSHTRMSAAAAAAAVTSDAPGAQSTAEPQPGKIKEDPSGSDDGPPDSSHSEHDTSALEISMKTEPEVSVKMESASTDGGTSSAKDSSNSSAFGRSSQQMVPQKNVTPTSTSADMTATKTAADEGDPLAASVTESPLPASDNLFASTALSPPGTFMTTSPGMTNNENADDSVDKVDVSEDRPRSHTTSASVINKTSSIESTNAAAEHGLWISGLTSSFRAADLKQLFSKFGKVVTAKVVTSAKSPGSKCFGFIVMSAANEALQAIKNLNNTEVQGQTITVEKDRQKRAILQQQAAAKPLQVTTTLWVNGLSTDTKAADLKMLFIKYGKVTGAKVVTSAKNPGTKCFGLVTMSSAEEAELCIARLNKTEFHGRIISLEKAKSDVKTQTKPNVTVSGKVAVEANSAAARKDEENKTAVNKAAAEKTSQKVVTQSKTAAAAANKLKQAEHVKDVKKDKNILSLDKIKEERERERRMQRERAAREEERRRQRELERERRLQQEEADRVARERERLRQEKVRLERERVRAERARIELERERHRQEKELEHERERLERLHRETRQQAPQYRSDMKRPSASGDDTYWPASKRQAVETRDSSSSYNYNMYSSGSGNYYEKSGPYASGERRDTQLRLRESDKGGSSAASLWASRQITDHRSSGSAMTSYGGASDFKLLRPHASGVTVGEWQSAGSAHRGTGSNYPSVGTESSRQYSGSASHAYFGPSGNQSYNKWY